MREIRSSVTQLERLDPELLPAVRACAMTDKSQTPGSTQHLKLLKREWTINVDLLIDNIDDVIDWQQFLEVSGK